VPKATLGMTCGSAQQGLIKGGSIGWLDGVEAGLTSPFQKNFSGLSILKRTMPRMIFKKYVIITRKFMNGKEMLGNIRYMKDITQYKWTSSSINQRMTVCKIRKPAPLPT
jgi:hypothetical protein